MKAAVSRNRDAALIWTCAKFMETGFTLKPLFFGGGDVLPDLVQPSGLQLNIEGAVTVFNFVAANINAP